MLAHPTEVMGHLTDCTRIGEANLQFDYNQSSLRIDRKNVDSATGYWVLNRIIHVEVPQSRLECLKRKRERIAKLSLVVA